MRPRRFLQLVWPVMITGLTACDNVAFGGIRVELRLPEQSPVDIEEEVLGTEADEPEPLEPVDLDLLVYVVQRTSGSRATILPIAQLSEGGYRALPDTAATPGLIERFSLGRWEEGAEFTLLSHGSRVGTLVTEGTTARDNSTCQVRPEAASSEWFLAEPTSAAATREPWVSLPPFAPDAPVRDASLNLAQRVIPVLGALWSPSIPDIRRDLQRFSMETEDESALAVSYVFGDRLSAGPSNPRA